MYASRVIFYLFLLMVFCFNESYGEEFLHDPTRPTTYSDNQTSIDSNSDKMTLDEVLISPFRRIAIVNGIAFEVGDIKSGIKMLSIDEYSVRIVKNQKEIKLVLPALDQSTIEIKRNL